MTPLQIGRYQLIREIERGGMATVFLAHDPNVDRDVAVKLLPREFLHYESFRERFDREAKIVAALEHRAIVPIFDFGEDDGQPFFVMRYMRGGSLANRLNNGRLSVDEAAEILKRIGSALDYAHSKDIVHRDLKPANILFDQFGQSFLADFGIALLQESGASLTGTAYLGTPAYVSPEQVQSTGEVDGRADIYALGVILFEVLTGDKPFKAKNAAFLALKHVTEPVPSILQANPDLPPDTDQIIARAMAKDPDDRYPTARDLTSAVTMLAIGQTLGTADGEHEIQAAPSGDLTAGAISAGTVAAGTQTDSTTPIPVPDLGTSPSVSEVASASTQRRFPLWLIGLIVVLVVVCLGVAAISITVAGGGSLIGLISNPTSTATVTTTPEPTVTELPTETPTAAATSSPTSTTLPSPTPAATASPTPLIPPTLRPTVTPEPTDTPAPTRFPTNTPVPPTATSAPQPPSDGGGGSDDEGSDNGGSPPDEEGGPPPPPPPGEEGGPPPPPPPDDEGGPPPPPPPEA